MAGVDSTADASRLLAAGEQGDPHALEQLFAVVYAELHALAARQIARERAGHTLQATALVHEAFLRLVGDEHRRWHDSTHFLAAAATAMRRILINHAVARGAQKRGGGSRRTELFEAASPFEEHPDDLLALDEALAKLAALDERKARLVELRFFAGLDTPQAAAALGVSTRTAERDWRLARAWLRREIEPG